MSILGILFAIVTIVAAPAKAQEASAPQFELKDVNGRIVRLSDYRGKVVVINFWATWCPPCRAEMPDLVKLQREYGKAGLQIIGISYPPQKKSRVARFAKSLKVNYPIALGTRELKARYSSDETLPLTVVIDRDGKVSEIISGILLREEFDEKIKPLLMKKRGDTGYADYQADCQWCDACDAGRDDGRSFHQDCYHSR
jgi:peroxiredoxin